MNGWYSWLYNSLKLKKCGIYMYISNHKPQDFFRGDAPFWWDSYGLPQDSFPAFFPMMIWIPYCSRKNLGFHTGSPTACDRDLSESSSPMGGSSSPWGDPQFDGKKIMGKLPSFDGWWLWWRYPHDLAYIDGYFFGASPPILSFL